MKYCLPSQQDALLARDEWRIAADERERALRNRHVRAMETYNEHSTELAELLEGDYVAIQNGNGSHPKRWDRTGRIMQALPFRQYRVKVDGSNRLQLRNRKFLRKIDPVCAHSSSTKVPPATIDAETIVPATASVDPQQTMPHPPSVELPPTASQENEAAPSQPTSSTQPEGVRTSGRVRQPRELFEANMHGKYHGYKPASQF